MTPTANARVSVSAPPASLFEAARLRIGVLAPEFTTQHGGMQEMAREVVARLSALADVEVIARSDRLSPTTDVPVRPLLLNDLRATRDILASSSQPDAWLALNAGLAALAPYLGAPMVVYVNGNDLLDPWFGFEGALVRLVEKLPRMDTTARDMRRRAFRTHLLSGAKSAALILANSVNTQKLVAQQLGPGGPPIRVIEPGVADAYFHDSRGAERRARPEGAPIHLLTVSRLTSAARRKNVSGVLRAVATLGPDVVSRYTIVGDGDDRPRLEQLAEELGLGDRAEFTGSLDRDALVARYTEADLFVLAADATDRDVEGFGIVYLEASAGGVPVLASRSGGATDAVVEGENGFMVPDGSPEAIAEGILSIQQGRMRIDPSRARAVAEQFRWSSVVQRLESELRDVAGFDQRES